MVAMLVLTVGLVAVCFLLGQGILTLCGAHRLRWWAPAVGYAVLLIVGGQLLRLPNHATAMAVVVLVAAAATVALPGVRRAAVEAAPDGVPFACGLILVAAIPFFATGRTGILGATVSNDMSSHLTAAYYLRTGQGLPPVAALGGNLIATGYPLGSQGLAAILTSLTGLGEEQTFSAITLAIPVLTGLAGLGLIPSARRAARWALGALVGLGYLSAAYFAQDSFKEITQALLVLATALELGDLTREDVGRRWLRAVPIGLLVGGSVYNYSYGGIVWMGAAAVFYLIVWAVRRPRTVLSVLRRAILPTLAAAVAAAIVVSPEISRVVTFTKSIFGAEPLTQQGNLFHALNPLEAMGTWFSADFRLNPAHEWVSIVFSSLGLLALGAGLVWWWRRRALALPAALAASIAIWIDFELTRNNYNAAKGLVVLAPLAIACAGTPLAAAWADARRVPRARWLRWGSRALGVVLCAGAVASTFAVLRSAPVGLGSHEQELASMRPLLRGKPVLFLANDHFAQWELRGAHVYVTTPLYVPAQLPMHPQKAGGITFDVDNYESSALDQMDYLLTPAAHYQSEIPPNFHLVMRTASYELYRRVGPTPAREPIEPINQPGVVFDCNLPAAKPVLEQFRWAGVLPTPVISTQWSNPWLVPGATAKMKVTLPPGRWDVSLQYLSSTSVAVSGPGLHTAIAPNYGLIGPYWAAGTVTSDGRAFTLTLHAANRSWFGRLIGTPRPMITEDSPQRTPLWHVAFTVHGATPQRIPIVQACGRYVDWVSPAGSTMH